MNVLFARSQQELAQICKVRDLELEVSEPPTWIRLAMEKLMLYFCKFSQQLLILAVQRL